MNKTFDYLLLIKKSKGQIQGGDEDTCPLSWTPTTNKRKTKVDSEQKSGKRVINRAAFLAVKALYLVSRQQSHHVIAASTKALFPAPS